MRMQLLLLAGLAAAASTGPATGTAANTPTPIGITINDAHTWAVAGPTTYAIAVKNTTATAQQVSVTAHLPPGLAVGAVSNAGKVTARRVVWALRLAPKRTTKVTVHGEFRDTGRRVSTACVAAATGNQVYACASDVDTPAFAAGAARRAWWPAVIASVALAGGLLWRQRRRWHKAIPSGAKARTATAVGLSALAVLIIAAIGVKVVASIVNSTAQARIGGGRAEPGSWQGPALSGRLAQTVRDDRNDYTVYQVACQPAGKLSQCMAKVAVHNRTTTPQRWYAQMQRLYLADGGWVAVAPAATASRNGGRDVFATELPPQQTALVQLVFTVPGAAQPRFLEVRTGAFRNGARFALS